MSIKYHQWGTGNEYGVNFERKYRKEYTAIKSEIDMYALQIINQ